MDTNLQGDTFVFRTRPLDFSPVVEVSSCYIEFDGKFLFLKRAANKPEGKTWGVPGGKIEPGETALEAVCRETFEETQIVLDQNHLVFVGTVFVRKPDVDFLYHMYHFKADQLPNVVLNDEHEEYLWLSEGQLEGIAIISGGLEALGHFKALANPPNLTRKPFYFIRHGETDVNANPKVKRVDYDLPLNSRGKEQAELARRVVKGISFKSVCFSPIQRAVETKDILVPDLDLDHHEIENLSECKAHIWTKMVQLEDGVGFQVCDEVQSFFRRVVEGVDSALQKTPDTLVVAHGGIHWALCYHLSIENHPWKIGNCVLVRFEPVGDTEWKAEIVSND